jgi:anthranilate synthase component 1
MPSEIVRPVIANAEALLAMHARQPERYPVLLQSTASNVHTGRYDILMAFPGEKLQLTSHGLQGHAHGNLFIAALDMWFAEESTGPGDVAEYRLPFTGGWFLFLGYELARELEPHLQGLPQASGVIAEAIRIPAAIVRCNVTGSAWIVAEAGHEQLIDEIAADLERSGSPVWSMAPAIRGAVEEAPPEEYIEAVQVALEHIRAGEIYQANLSRGWRARLHDDMQPHDLYRRLWRANAGPFAALAVLGHTTVVSSSPERLLEIRNGVASTRPIAGTRPRSRNAARDLELLQQLRRDPKELAEHTMLIDLERNDLGRICASGTVVVDEFMTLESYAHVHHIVSNVRGRVRPGVTPGRAIAAVFPGGTITGCPKIRCMEIIGALERTPRQAYTGSLGYLNRNGDMDLNILIRTLEIRDREIRFRAGAGIVADSDPHAEVEETRAKARGLLAALERVPEV